MSTQEQNTPTLSDETKVLEAFKRATYIRFFDNNWTTIGYCHKKGYEFLLDGNPDVYEARSIIISLMTIINEDEFEADEIILEAKKFINKTFKPLTGHE